MEIFPSLEPDMTYLLQGEKATVHKSTGPKDNKCCCWPVCESQKHKLESKELLAIAEIKLILKTILSAGNELHFNTHFYHRNLRPQKPHPMNDPSADVSILKCYPPLCPTL